MPEFPPIVDANFHRSPLRPSERLVHPVPVHHVNVPAALKVNFNGFLAKKPQARARPASPFHIEPPQKNALHRAEWEAPRLMFVSRSFEPTYEDDEIQIRIGEAVRVLEGYDNEWCLVQRVGHFDAEQGFVPRHCLAERPEVVPTMGNHPTPVDHGSASGSTSAMRPQMFRQRQSSLSRTTSPDTSDAGSPSTQTQAPFYSRLDLSALYPRTPYSFPSLNEAEQYLRASLNLPPDKPVNLWALHDPPNRLKPAQPYPVLVKLAIFGSPHKRLLLQEIHQALIDRFEWFQDNSGESAWKVCLALCFILPLGLTYSNKKFRTL